VHIAEQARQFAISQDLAKVDLRECPPDPPLKIGTCRLQGQIEAGAAPLEILVELGAGLVQRQ
jgi:hypothetical protein